MRFGLSKSLVVILVAVLLAGGVSTAQADQGIRPGVVTPQAINATSPTVILDTSSVGVKVGELDGTGAAYELQVTGNAGVPSGALAVALNVAAVSTETNDFGGFVSVYPCGTRPDASNLNFTSGVDARNSFIAPVSSAGKVCFYVYGKAHLIVESLGYYEVSDVFEPLTPTRVLDSRSGEQVTSERSMTVAGTAGVPSSGVTAIQANVTVVSPSGDGFVTISDCTTDVASMAFQTGTTGTFNFVLPLSTSGAICYRATASTHLLLDVSGYFTGTPGITSLSSPQNMTVDSDTLVVSWEAPSLGTSNIDHYVASISDVGSCETADASTLTCTITGITESAQTYAADVYAVSTTGLNGPPAGGELEFGTFEPPVFTGEPTATTREQSWEMSAQVRARVELSGVGATVTAIASKSRDLSNPLTSTQSLYYLSWEASGYFNDLEPETTYYYKISVENEYGSDETAVYSFTTGTQPPPASILINGGAEYTNSRIVTVDIELGDYLGWDTYKIGFLQDEPDYSAPNNPWELGGRFDYQPTMETLLADGEDGERSVYAMLEYDNGSDGGGDMMGSDTIILDRTRPVITDRAVTQTSSTFTVEVTATDALAGVESVTLAAPGRQVRAAYVDGVTVQLDLTPDVLCESVIEQETPVVLTVRDAAGNVTAPISYDVDMQVCAPDPVTESETINEVADGVAVSGASFTVGFPAGTFGPSEWVYLELHSTPVAIGYFLTEEDGSLNAIFEVTTSLGSGEHTLYVRRPENAGVISTSLTVTESIGSSFTSLLKPERLLDTRSGDKVGEIDGTGAAYVLQVGGEKGVPSSGVGAVALNVTVVDGEAGDYGGYVTVYPCGTRPDASNLNFTSGQTIPNAVIAPVSSSGEVCFYVYGKAHLLADVSGYFSSGFSSLLKPERLLDTRSGDKVGEIDGTGAAYSLQVGGEKGVPSSGVGAVALNVTVVDGEAGDYGGYVTVYPCGTRPDASNLNFTSGQTIPNSVIAPVSAAGKVCFYVYGKAHLLADVSGYFN